MAVALVKLPQEMIADFCRRWKVRELSLFGSVLGDDFGPHSDVDVLVTFADDAEWDLWDLLDARDKLQELFGREVDLVEERSLVNPYRRASILRGRKVIYAAD